VENIFLRSDENDVVDVGVGLAATTFEVEKEDCGGLTNITSISLSHTQTVGAEVALTLAEAEVVADFFVVEELIVVTREVKSSSMRPAVDKVADVAFLGELNTKQRVLTERSVSRTWFANGAEASLGVLWNDEKFNVTLDVLAVDLSDAPFRSELLKEGVLDLGRRTAVSVELEVIKSIAVQRGVSDVASSGKHVRAGLGMDTRKRVEVLERNRLGSFVVDRVRRAVAGHRSRSCGWRGGSGSRRGERRGERNGRSAEDRSNERRVR
jgi:hypothetical protein